jgi:hypothetical protein
MRNKKGRHCRPFSLGRSKRLEVLDQVVPLFRVAFQVARRVVVRDHVRERGGAAIMEIRRMLPEPA